MISDQNWAVLESLGLRLDSISFSSSSTKVSVGVRDDKGMRHIGQSVRTDHDPDEALETAFRDALHQFNPDWERCVEKSVAA